MKKVKVKPNQTLFDIAIEQYGNAEASNEIIELNPNLRNDTAALIAAGKDPVANDTFFFDLSVEAEMTININTDSKYMNGNILKELTGEITTFDHGEKY